jgi:hypothetical protein
MPTEKKLLAAAAFTRQQADFFADQVENIRRKVERARADLDATEAALERAIEKAEEKQLEAAAAAEAAEGLSVFVSAQPAQFGVV